MPLPAIISALAPLIGAGVGLIGSNSAADSAREGVDAQNEMNLRLARDARAFERHMSNSAYQRAVRDMELAGLNPAVMFGAGGGHAASTPGATVIPAQNRQAQAVSSALEAKRLTKDVAEAASRIRLNKSQVKLTEAQEKKTLQEVGTSAQVMHREASQTELNELDARVKKNQLQLSDAEAAWVRKYGSLMGFTSALSKAIQGGNQLLGK